LRVVQPTQVRRTAGQPASASASHSRTLGIKVNSHRGCHQS